jgi:hypothetical protein
MVVAQSPTVIANSISNYEGPFLNNGTGLSLLLLIAGTQSRLIYREAGSVDAVHETVLTSRRDLARKGRGKPRPYKEAEHVDKPREAQTSLHFFANKVRSHAGSWQFLPPQLFLPSRVT